MSNVHPLPVTLNPLHELQKSFALMTLSGQVLIVNRHEVAEIVAGQRAGDLSFYKMTDGKIMLKRALEAMPAYSDTTKVVKDFTYSTTTLAYDKIAFSPFYTPPTTLNYWVGSPIVPVSGDWSILEEFLKSIICSSDDTLFSYLIQFLAHMLKKPEEKPGVMFVLLAGQGTGKGSFFRILHAIWRNTTLQVSDVDNVIGTYNAAIERKYVICMDEALFNGDRRAADRLKSMVTESMVTIEQKYQPRRNIESFHRFFAASNHDHFGQVDPDDRRFTFLRVSEARRGDRSYFGQVHNAIDSPEIIAAFVHHLHSIDLSNFNVRDRPKTDELVVQKLSSLKGFDRFWHEVLQSGNLDPVGALDPWYEARFVSTASLIKAWKGYEGRVRQFIAPQASEIRKALNRACPSSFIGRMQVQDVQGRGQNLPLLSVAREEFERMVGGAINWYD